MYLVVVAGMFLFPADTRRRPLALPLGSALQNGPLRLVHAVGLLGVRTVGGSLGLERPPAPPNWRARACVPVELEHVGYGALEKGAVVRHDDHSASTTGDHLLQPGQAVEVEIVGRLVQEGDVEARQQQGGQRGTSFLATRQGRPRLVEHRFGQSHLAEGGHEPGVEVAGRGRLEPGQGCGVAVLGIRRAFGECGRGVGQRGLCGGHAGTPLEGGAHGLVGSGVLLVEIADDGPWRVHDHFAGAGNELSGQHLQQCRLADPVRPDHAQTRAGGDVQ